MVPEDFSPRLRNRLTYVDKVAAHALVEPGAPAYWAYVPAVLPKSVDLSADLISQLSNADRAVGELAGAGKTLQDPHLLIRPFIRREAVLSSRIEGTEASLRDLFLFEVAPVREPKVSDVREVANYVKALDFGIENEHQLPVSTRLIRGLHQILLKDVRGKDKSPGQFRRGQNWIGPQDCSLDQAYYVPPPPLEIDAAMSALEIYIHANTKTPPLIRLALVHYQFEAIHPFVDGNGRIGRLLIALLLCVQQILPAPLLYLSAFFERHRKEYYDRLFAVSANEQWDEWIDFFLRGVEEQANDAVVRSNRLWALRQQWYEQLQSARASALTLKLVDELFSYPAITTAVARRTLDISWTAARSHVMKLVDAKLLQEVTGRKRNQIFLAIPIIDIISAAKATEVD